MFLHGFVFMTSFWGKFGDLLIELLPSCGESLEYHLVRTDFLGNGTCVLSLYKKREIKGQDDVDWDCIIIVHLIFIVAL